MTTTEFATTRKLFAEYVNYKQPMSFDEWMQYLDFCYNTKGGKRNKNINKYLREKGFID